MKPYTYYLRNTKTNQKYYGLRYGNTVSADEDFGIHYFSSGDLKHEFRQNPEIFEWRIMEHETTELARAYEDKILRKVVNKPGWVNHHVSGIIMTDEIAQKIKNTLTGTKRPRHVVDKILRTKAIMGTNGQPWTNQGGTFDTEILDEGSPSDLYWEEFDVTDEVIAYIGNPGQNYGFIIEADHCPDPTDQYLSKQRHYHSSEVSTATNRPSLTIEYYVP